MRLSDLEKRNRSASCTLVVLASVRIAEIKQSLVSRTFGSELGKFFCTEIEDGHLGILQGATTKSKCPAEDFERFRQSGRGWELETHVRIHRLQDGPVSMPSR